MGGGREDLRIADAAAHEDELLHRPASQVIEVVHVTVSRHTCVRDQGVEHLVPRLARGRVPSQRRFLPQPAARLLGGGLSGRLAALSATKCDGSMSLTGFSVHVVYVKVRREIMASPMTRQMVAALCFTSSTLVIVSALMTRIGVVIMRCLIGCITS